VPHYGEADAGKPESPLTASDWPAEPPSAAGAQRPRGRRFLRERTPARKRPVSGRLPAPARVPAAVWVVELEPWIAVIRDAAAERKWDVGSVISLISD